MEMDIDVAVASLREKHHSVESDPYLYQAGPMRGRVHYIVDGVSMPFHYVFALDRGDLTLGQIAARLEQESQQAH